MKKIILSILLIIATLFARDWDFTHNQLAGGDSSNENWHYLGQANEPQFENGAANFSSSFVQSRFKEKDGVVYMQGLIKGFQKNKVIFTIPDGYRPSQKLLTKQIKTGGRICRVDITTNGQLICRCANSGYLTLNISYLTD